MKSNEIPSIWPGIYGPIANFGNRIGYLLCTLACSNLFEPRPIFTDSVTISYHRQSQRCRLETSCSSVACWVEDPTFSYIFCPFLSIQSKGVDYFSEFCWSVLCEVLNQLQARPGEFFLATCVAICRCLCLEVSIRVDIANFRPLIKLEFDAVVAVGCRLAMNCLE